MGELYIVEVFDYSKKYKGKRHVVYKLTDEGLKKGLGLKVTPSHVFRSLEKALKFAQHFREWNVKKVFV
jgi:hypothetical protein